MLREKCGFNFDFLYRFEFPALLNLNAFIEDGEKKEPQDFLLHAVLVHSGDFHGGHYVVFINTNLGGPPKVLFLGYSWKSFVY